MQWEILYHHSININVNALELKICFWCCWNIRLRILQFEINNRKSVKFLKTENKWEGWDMWRGGRRGTPSVWEGKKRTYKYKGNLIDPALSNYLSTLTWGISQRVADALSSLLSVCGVCVCKFLSEINPPSRLMCTALSGFERKWQNVARKEKQGGAQAQKPLYTPDIAPWDFWRFPYTEVASQTTEESRSDEVVIPKGASNSECMHRVCEMLGEGLKKRDARIQYRGEWYYCPKWKDYFSFLPVLNTLICTEVIKK